MKASCAKTLQTYGFLAPSHRSLRMSLGENMLNLDCRNYRLMLHLLLPSHHNVLYNVMRYVF